MRWRNVKGAHPSIISIFVTAKTSTDGFAELVKLKQNDVDELVSLRLSGTERVWAIRSNNVLKVL